MKVGITGCTGRVGSLLVQELQSGEWEKAGLELAGGTVLPEDLDKDYSFPVTDKAEELFKDADVVIDFTCPMATLRHAELAAENSTTLIIGTTGLTNEQEAQLEKASEKTTLIYAANMSVGVNLLLALVEQAAARLGPEDWDIEIFESHHKHKVDAPSGTALAVGKAAAQGREVDHDKVAVRARDGITGPRETGTIGYSVARGGDVVGEHTAFFYGAGERIELTHVATNRALFARGALRAALESADLGNGLFSMRDILNI